MNHASIFSGIGGPEIAASILGWENAFHCEVHPWCRHILHYWYPNSVSYENIFNTDFKQWRGKIDVLSGGFPCQPFSVAGQRKGTKDDRYLWPQMLRAIDEIRPSWVVAENVIGLVSMVESGMLTEMDCQADLFEEKYNVHRYKYSMSFTLESICKDIENLGYNVQPLVIPACSVGAPHRRKRLFIIAYAENTNSMGLQGNEVMEHLEMSRNSGTTSNNGQIKSSASNSNDPRFKTVRERTFRFRQPRVASNPLRRGGRPFYEQIKSNVTDGKKSLSFGGKRSTTNTDSKRRGTLHDKAEEKRTQSNYVLPFICGGIPYPFFNRWRNFPSVPAVHRRNDGIPFPLDCLTIPWRTWRYQTIRAYGNAIVPQVIFEIFRAIEIVSNNTKMQI